jgi:HEAT repeat protein
VELRRAFPGPDVLRVALDLAARLEDPPDPARRIAENTRREPDPRVRRLNIRMLSREFPESPATREALLAAREDADAEVRLAAGTALGEEGREVLLRLAAGEGVEDQTAASAVEALGARLGVEDARGILQKALGADRPATAAPQSTLKKALRTRRATARACLGVLGDRGGAEALATLGTVLTTEEDDLATAAADSLARTGDPGAEGPLLRTLSSGSPAVRLAAARALGRVGTAAAVAPLVEAESRGGELRRAARQAVAEIQLRLAEAAGAAPGQLSLAGGEAGQVSLVEEAAEGQLTLTEPAAAAEDAPHRPRPPTTPPERE